MKLKLPLLLLAVGYLTMGAAAPVRMTPVKITDNVYMLQHSGGSGNSTVVITNDGVVVLDFAIDSADQTLAFIRKTTDKKVKYLITSHSAGDHATGSMALPRRQAHLDCAPKIRSTISNAGVEGFQRAQKFQRPALSPPTRKANWANPISASTAPTTLYFGGLTFQITPEGRGHSTGDLTVYIPQKRVMLMGDLLDTEIHPGPRRVGRDFLFQRQRLDSNPR